MNPNLESSAEKLSEVPEILLEEGPDFIDNGELYTKIENELIKLQIDPAYAMLCGHAKKTEGDLRSKTFALSLQEIQEGLEYQSNWTPFEYAEEAAVSTEGVPVISVYDAKLLEPDSETYGSFKTVNGIPLHKVLILRINISLQ